jgi:hypothetical protein
MPYFGLEFHFGWLIWVLLGEEDINLKETSFVWGIRRPFNIALPMPGVIIAESYFNI